LFIHFYATLEDYRENGTVEKNDVNLMNLVVLKRSHTVIIARMQTYQKKTRNDKWTASTFTTASDQRRGYSLLTHDETHGNSQVAVEFKAHNVTRAGAQSWTLQIQTLAQNSIDSSILEGIEYLNLQIGARAIQSTVYWLDAPIYVLNGSRAKL